MTFHCDPDVQVDVIYLGLLFLKGIDYCIAVI